MDVGKQLVMIPPFVDKVQRKGLHLLYCLLNSYYEQINLGYKILIRGEVGGEPTPYDYSSQQELPQRTKFSFVGCDIENLKGGGAAAHTITLVITCKLKTNLFMFCAWDSGAQRLGFISPFRHQEDV